VTKLTSAEAAAVGVSLDAFDEEVTLTLT